MELNRGLCGICKCKNAVLKPMDAEHFWKIARDLYEDDLTEISNLKLVENICPLCIFQILKIQKKDECFKQYNPEEEFPSNICIFCKDEAHLLQIQDPKVLSQLELKNIGTQTDFTICIACFYVKNISITFRENLVRMIKLSRMKDPTEKKNKNKRSRGSSNQSEKPSDDIELIEETTNEIVSNNSRPEFNKSIECDNEKSLFTLNISKDKNAILIDSDDEENDTKKPPLKVTLKGIIYSNDSFKSDDFKATKRSSRKRKASESPEKDIKPKTKKAKVSSGSIGRKVLINGYDISRILQSSPLYKSEVEFDSKIKEDQKLFKSLPFVKMVGLEHERSAREYQTFKVVNYSNKKQRSTMDSAPSTSTNKRTPPIKIKLKQRLPKEKKEEKAESGDVLSDMKKKKVVVKVTRLELDEVKTTSHKRNSMENGNFLKTSKDEDVLAAISETTPVKKKKRVHFNDTPTIIITRDEPSEELDSITEEEETTVTPKKKNVRNGKTLTKLSKKKNNDIIEIEDDESSVPEKSEEDKREEPNESINKMEKVNLEEKTEELEKDKTDTDENDIEEKTKQSSDDKNEVKVNGDEKLSDDDSSGSKKNEDENKESDNAENNNENNAAAVCHILDESDDDLQVVDECQDGDVNSDSDNNDKTLFNSDSGEKTDENEEKVGANNEEKNLEDFEDASKSSDSLLGNSVITGSDEFLKQNDEVSNEANKSEVNSEVVVSSKEAGASEDFGSLIDEVQKCLTSTKELSTDSTDGIELHTDELDELFENDKLKSISETGDEGVISEKTVEVNEGE